MASTGEAGAVSDFNENDNFGPIQSISESDIQRRIDAAVKVALASQREPMACGHERRYEFEIPWEGDSGSCGVNRICALCMAKHVINHASCLPHDSKDCLLCAKDAELAAAKGRVVSIEDLVRHCWIHEGYPRCGYDQMTTDQKALYEEILAGLPD